MLLGAWGNCPTGCGLGGSSLLGGGESVASSSPSGPPDPSAGCGGSLENFLEWLATENWAAFEMWYQCMTGGL